ncbi:MAG: aminotransferase class V-fold PLP-dependent enzyme [Hyphomonadaceae bacterium]
MIDTPRSRQDCEALDRADPLGPVRAQFALPDGVIYLDGHSLGPATHAALARVERAAREEWREGLIRSWNTAGWIDLPRTVGAKLARLIGVAAGDVIVADSVSVNLFKLAAAALPIAKSRTVIVETSEFPTDQYVAEGLAELSGATLMRVGEHQGVGALEQTGGVLIRSIVNYRSSDILSVADCEAVARRNGGVIVWDLSHATGVLDLKLEADGARLATGCTYKFLNGGPGAPAFVYVQSDLAERLASPISGWFGHADPFAFTPAYAPREGVSRFAAGTPGVLSLSALDAALDAFGSVELGNIGAKTSALGNLVIARADAMSLPVLSPRDGARRGGHVSLLHDNGYPIVQALIARGIIPDFRAPDTMRFGVAPLYVRFVDVWDAMDQLADILETRAWDRPEFHARTKVT